MTMNSEGSAFSLSEPLKLPRLARDRLTISSEVTNALRWRIIEGRLPSGARLGEERISREMGISRGPVREALRELENEGLIAVEPYRGAVVIGISVTELRNVVIPIRRILERSAIERSLSGMTDDVFDVLAGITSQMDDVAESGSETTLRDLVELDVAFHRTVVEASPDHHTKQLWRAMQSRIRMGFYQLGTRHSDSGEIAREHGELLIALRTRDLDIALAAFDSHAMGSPLALLDQSVKNSELHESTL